MQKPDQLKIASYDPKFSALLQKHCTGRLCTIRLATYVQLAGYYSFLGLAPIAIINGKSGWDKNTYMLDFGRNYSDHGRLRDIRLNMT